MSFSPRALAFTLLHVQPQVYFVGLMSGTSADGIDAVAAALSGRGERTGAQLLAHVRRPFPAALRRRLLDAAVQGTVAELCELNFLLGEWFARAAMAAIKAARLTPARIAAIGSHGQTFHHLPQGSPPSTLQLGEPAVIAERTGIMTIGDFRVADMAAGGQGAPLVPYADWALLTDSRRPRIVQNLGGIANLTFLPAAARLDQVLAFDTGPGNMVLDGLVTQLTHGRRALDHQGAWAAQGKVSADLLATMMTHPFLRRRPPKTTGREEFGAAYCRKLLAEARKARLPSADLLATATAFTAASIAEACQRFVFPKLAPADRQRLQVILGGGGVRNRILCAMVHERLGPIELLTHEDLGIPNAAKEALAFALLARQTLLHLPGNVPGATGAKYPAVLGKIVLPPQIECAPRISVRLAGRLARTPAGTAGSKPRRVTARDFRATIGRVP